MAAPHHAASCVPLLCRCSPRLPHRPQRLQLWQQRGGHSRVLLDGLCGKGGWRGSAAAGRSREGLECGADAWRLPPSGHLRAMQTIHE